jgi:hypothetical protein
LKVGIFGNKPGKAVGKSRPGAVGQVIELAGRNADTVDPARTHPTRIRCGFGQWL